MRQDASFFEGQDPVLIYIAKKLKDALKLEERLTAAGVDYAVEPDHYTGGVIFRTERVGAFFYVASAAADTTRQLLKENGFRPVLTG